MSNLSVLALSYHHQSLGKFAPCYVLSACYLVLRLRRICQTLSKLPPFANLSNLFQSVLSQNNLYCRSHQIKTTQQNDDAIGNSINSSRSSASGLPEASTQRSVENGKVKLKPPIENPNSSQRFSKDLKSNNFFLTALNLPYPMTHSELNEWLSVIPIPTKYEWSDIELLFQLQREYKTKDRCPSRTTTLDSNINQELLFYEVEEIRVSFLAALPFFLLAEERLLIDSKNQSLILIEQPEVTDYKISNRNVENGNSYPQQQLNLIKRCPVSIQSLTTQTSLHLRVQSRLRYNGSLSKLFQFARERVRRLMHLHLLSLAEAFEEVSKSPSIQNYDAQNGEKIKDTPSIIQLQATDLPWIWIELLELFLNQKSENNSVRSLILQVSSLSSSPKNETNIDSRVYQFGCLLSVMLGTLEAIGDSLVFEDKIYDARMITQPVSKRDNSSFTNFTHDDSNTDKVQGCPLKPTLGRTNQDDGMLNATANKTFSTWKLAQTIAFGDFIMELRDIVSISESSRYGRNIKSDQVDKKINTHVKKKVVECRKRGILPKPFKLKKSQEHQLSCAKSFRQDLALSTQSTRQQSTESSTYSYDSRKIVYNMISEIEHNIVLLQSWALSNSEKPNSKQSNHFSTLTELNRWQVAQEFYKEGISMFLSNATSFPGTYLLSVSAALLYRVHLGLPIVDPCDDHSMENTETPATNSTENLLETPEYKTTKRLVVEKLEAELRDAADVGLLTDRRVALWSRQLLRRACVVASDSNQSLLTIVDSGDFKLFASVVTRAVKTLRQQKSRKLPDPKEGSNERENIRIDKESSIRSIIPCTYMAASKTLINGRFESSAVTIYTNEELATLIVASDISLIVNYFCDVVSDYYQMMKISSKGVSSNNQVKTRQSSNRFTLNLLLYLLGSLVPESNFSFGTPSTCAERYPSGQSDCVFSNDVRNLFCVFFQVAPSLIDMYSIEKPLIVDRIQNSLHSEVFSALIRRINLYEPNLFVLLFPLFLNQLKGLSYKFICFQSNQCKSEIYNNQQNCSQQSSDVTSFFHIDIFPEFYLSLENLLFGCNSSDLRTSSVELLTVFQRDIFHIWPNFLSLYCQTLIDILIDLATKPLHFSSSQTNRSIDVTLATLDSYLRTLTRIVRIFSASIKGDLIKVGNPVVSSVGSPSVSPVLSKRFLLLICSIRSNFIRLVLFVLGNSDIFTEELSQSTGSYDGQVEQSVFTTNFPDATPFYQKACRTFQSWVILSPKLQQLLTACAKQLSVLNFLSNQFHSSNDEVDQFFDPRQDLSSPQALPVLMKRGRAERKKKSKIVDLSILPQTCSNSSILPVTNLDLFLWLQWTAIRALIIYEVAQGDMTEISIEEASSMESARVCENQAFSGLQRNGDSEKPHRPKRSFSSWMPGCCKKKKIQRDPYGSTIQRHTKKLNVSNRATTKDQNLIPQIEDVQEGVLSRSRSSKMPYKTSGLLHSIVDILSKGVMPNLSISCCSSHLSYALLNLHGITTLMSAAKPRECKNCSIEWVQSSPLSDPLAIMQHLFRGLFANNLETKETVPLVMSYEKPTSNSSETTNSPPCNRPIGGSNHCMIRCSNELPSQAMREVALTSLELGFRTKLRLLGWNLAATKLNVDTVDALWLLTALLEHDSVAIRHLLSDVTLSLFSSHFQMWSSSSSTVPRFPFNALTILLAPQARTLLRRQDHYFKISEEGRDHQLQHKPKEIEQKTPELLHVQKSTSESDITASSDDQSCDHSISQVIERSSLGVPISERLPTQFQMIEQNSMRKQSSGEKSDKVVRQMSKNENIEDSSDSIAIGDTIASCYLKFYINSIQYCMDALQIKSDRSSSLFGGSLYCAEYHLPLTEPKQPNESEKPSLSFDQIKDYFIDLYLSQFTILLLRLLWVEGSKASKNSLFPTVREKCLLYCLYRLIRSINPQLFCHCPLNIIAEVINVLNRESALPYASIEVPRQSTSRFTTAGACLLLTSVFFDRTTPSVRSSLKSALIGLLSLHQLPPFLHRNHDLHSEPRQRLLMRYHEKMVGSLESLLIALSSGERPKQIKIKKSQQQHGVRRFLPWKWFNRKEVTYFEPEPNALLGLLDGWFESEPLITEVFDEQRPFLQKKLIPITYRDAEKNLKKSPENSPHRRILFSTQSISVYSLKFMTSQILNSLSNARRRHLVACLRNIRRRTTICRSVQPSLYQIIHSQEINKSSCPVDICSSHASFAETKDADLKMLEAVNLGKAQTFSFARQRRSKKSAHNSSMEIATCEINVSNLLQEMEHYLQYDSVTLYLPQIVPGCTCWTTQPSSIEPYVSADITALIGIIGIVYLSRLGHTLMVSSTTPMLRDLQRLSRCLFNISLDTRLPAEYRKQALSFVEWAEDLTNSAKCVSYLNFSSFNFFCVMAFATLNLSSIHSRNSPFLPHSLTIPSIQSLSNTLTKLQVSHAFRLFDHNSSYVGISRSTPIEPEYKRIIRLLDPLHDFDAKLNVIQGSDKTEMEKVNPDEIQNAAPSQGCSRTVLEFLMWSGSRFIEAKSWEDFDSLSQSTSFGSQSCFPHHQVKSFLPLFSRAIAMELTLMNNSISMTLCNNIWGVDGLFNSTSHFGSSTQTDWSGILNGFCLNRGTSIDDPETIEETSSSNTSEAQKSNSNVETALLWLSTSLGLILNRKSVDIGSAFVTRYHFLQTRTQKLGLLSKSEKNAQSQMDQLGYNKVENKHCVTPDLLLTEQVQLQDCELLLPLGQAFLARHHSIRTRCLIEQRRRMLMLTFLPKSYGSLMRKYSSNQEMLPPTNLNPSSSVASLQVPSSGMTSSPSPSVPFFSTTKITKFGRSLIPGLATSSVRLSRRSTKQPETLGSQLQGAQTLNPETQFVQPQTPPISTQSSQISVLHSKSEVVTETHRGTLNILPKALRLSTRYPQHQTLMPHCSRTLDSIKRENVTDFSCSHSIELTEDDSEESSTHREVLVNQSRFSYYPCPDPSPLVWSDHLTSLSIVVAFHGFSGALTWPRPTQIPRRFQCRVSLEHQSTHNSHQLEKTDRTGDTIDQFRVVFAIRELLRILGGYRRSLRYLIVQRRGHLKHLKPKGATTATTEAYDSVHSTALAKLTLLELLLKDDLLRVLVWWGLPRKWSFLTETPNFKERVIQLIASGPKNEQNETSWKGKPQKRRASSTNTIGGSRSDGTKGQELLISTHHDPHSSDGGLVVKNKRKLSKELKLLKPDCAHLKLKQTDFALEDASAMSIEPQRGSTDSEVEDEFSKSTAQFPREDCVAIVEEHGGQTSEFDPVATASFCVPARKSRRSLKPPKTYISEGEETPMRVLSQLVRPRQRFLSSSSSGSSLESGQKKDIDSNDNYFGGNDVESRQHFKRKGKDVLLSSISSIESFDAENQINRRQSMSSSRSSTSSRRMRIRGRPIRTSLGHFRSKCERRPQRLKRLVRFGKKRIGSNPELNEDLRVQFVRCLSKQLQRENAHQKLRSWPIQERQEVYTKTDTNTGAHRRRRVHCRFSKQKLQRPLRIRTASRTVRQKRSRVEKNEYETVRMPSIFDSNMTKRTEAQLFVQRRGRLPLKSLPFPTQKSQLWKSLLQEAWNMSPPVVSQLIERFPTRKSLRKASRKIQAQYSHVTLMCILIAPQLNSHLIDVSFTPWAVSKFGRRSAEVRLREMAPKTKTMNTKLLTFFGCGSQSVRPPGGTPSPHQGSLSTSSALTRFPWIYLPIIPIASIIPLLHRDHRNDLLARRMVLRTFEFHGVQIPQLYLLELIQSLRADSGRVIESFLIDMAKTYPSFHDLLIFPLSTELIPSTKTEGRKVALPTPDFLPSTSARIISLLRVENSREAGYSACDYQYCFFDKLIQLSGELLLMSPAQRMSHLRNRLMQMIESEELKSKSVYLPSNPYLRITSLFADSAKLMQSAAKTPFLLRFGVEPFAGVDIIRRNSAAQLYLQRQINLKEKSILNFDIGKGNQVNFHFSERATRSVDRTHLYSNTATTIKSLKGLPSSRTNAEIIFKLNDDIRQDQLAIQIITLFKHLFKRANLPLWLRTYHVVPHRVISKEEEQEKGFEAKNKSTIVGLLGGMIEVIPNAVSRHQLGRSMECSLSQYFALRYGGPKMAGSTDKVIKFLEDKMEVEESENEKTTVTVEKALVETCSHPISESATPSIHIDPMFNSSNEYFFCSKNKSYSASTGKKGIDYYSKAQWEFIRSLAAYSLASFLLQVKDRHNGNLMITQQGQILHIDFGYLFDFSPGRDMRFEKAPFKLTLEMIEILGGSAQAEEFQIFEQLVIQGYLVVRQEAALFLHLVSTMHESGLPCFKKQSLRNLRQRLQLEVGPDEAADYMHKQIIASYNAFSTRLYDVVQSIQQGIAR